MEREIRKDFFISYTSADRTWAEWIAWQLEQAGYTTVIQVWDFRPGSNFVQEMDTATKGAKRTIAVLSPDYFHSGFRPSEWQVAFRRDPKGEQRLLVPVRVRECDVEGLLGSIVYIDLVSHDEREAHERLLAGVCDARAKPTSPPAFPAVVSHLPESPAFPGAFPALWTVPYPRNPFFTGRNELLQDLRAALERGQATALTQAKAISGLGGIGKTQLAVEYAYQHYKDYQAVFWVRAETRENLVSDFVAMAGELQLSEQDAREVQHTIRAVQTWLRRHSGWLLILDNADNLALAEEFLPPTSGGHVLLTTQAQAMGRLAGRIEVGTMREEVGVLFLLRRAGLIEPDGSVEHASLQDRAIACELMHELGGLPLALDQAGAYREETQCGLEEYLKLYRSQRATLLGRRGGRVPDHKASVATTLSLAFASVERGNPSAAALLRLCAFLDPDAIPEDLLRLGATQLELSLQTLGTDDLTFHDALRTLGDYSLLHRERSSRTLTIHRLVQAVLIDTLLPEDQQVWVERTTRLIIAALPAVPAFPTWARWERLLPHALTCAAHLQRTQVVSQEAAYLMCQTGQYLKERGQYAEAQPFLTQALILFEQSMGREHLSPALGHLATALGVVTLGSLYGAQGRYAEADSLFQRSLVIYEHELGPIHFYTATTLINLAVIYREQGKYAEAEPLFQRSLAIREQELGLTHPDTATVLNELAGLYRELGQYVEAEVLYQRALAIRQQQLGPMHPSTANSLYHLATLYDRQGKYAEAEPLYQRALRIREQQLGQEHPHTAEIVHDLARLWEARDNSEVASIWYARALAVREQALGAHHPKTIETRTRLIALLHARGQHEEAAKLVAAQSKP